MTTSPGDTGTATSPAGAGMTTSPAGAGTTTSSGAGRRPMVAGNWKMHKTMAEAEAFIQALLPRISTADRVDVGICPSFTSLQAVVDASRGSRVQVFAQNVHQADQGPFTGEVW